MKQEIKKKVIAKAVLRYKIIILESLTSSAIQEAFFVMGYNQHPNEIHKKAKKILKNTLKYYPKSKITSMLFKSPISKNIRTLPMGANKKEVIDMCVSVMNKKMLQVINMRKQSENTNSRRFS